MALHDDLDTLIRKTPGISEKELSRAVRREGPAFTRALKKGWNQFLWHRHNDPGGTWRFYPRGEGPRQPRIPRAHPIKGNGER